MSHHPFVPHPVRVTITFDLVFQRVIAPAQFVNTVTDAENIVEEDVIRVLDEAFESGGLLWRLQNNETHGTDEVPDYTITVESL